MLYLVCILEFLVCFAIYQTKLPSQENIINVVTESDGSAKLLYYRNQTLSSGWQNVCLFFYFPSYIDSYIKLLCRRAHRITVLVLFLLALVYVSFFEEIVQDSLYNQKR